MIGEELKPCPFCGHAEIVTPTKNYSNVPIPQCGNCGAEAPTKDGWNRRTPDPETVRRLDAMADAAKEG